MGDLLVRRRLGQGRRALPTPRPWLLPSGLVGVAAAAGLALHSLGGGSIIRGLFDVSVITLLESSTGRVVGVELVAFIVATAGAARRNRAVAISALAVVVIAEGMRSHLEGEAAHLGSIVIVVHLAAGAVWLGALVHVMRTVVSWRRSIGQATGLLIEYAVLALGLYWAVVTTGTIAAILVLPSPAALWSTGYGRILLAKLVLVGVVSALAVTARRRLRRPHSAAGTLPLVRLEVPVLIGVVAASATLTAIAPPMDPAQELAYPAAATGPTVRLGTLAGQITAGIVATEGQLEVRLRVPGWDPSADHQFQVAGMLAGPDGTATSLDLDPCGAGCFVGAADWGAGINRLDLDVEAADWRGNTSTFRVPWPADDARSVVGRMLAAMALQPGMVLLEKVTSDTTDADGSPGQELRTSGREFLDLQPYRSGEVDAPTVLSRRGDLTEIGFAITAESIYVRQTVDADGRLVAETLVTPNHLIERSFDYR